MDSKKLAQRLREFDYNMLSEKERRGSPYRDLFLAHVLGVHRSNLPAPSSVCWFHGTRVAPGTTFDDGILPLSESLDRIWGFLGRLAKQWSSRKEWEAFRANMTGQGAAQYYRKVSSPFANGPCAVLVREILLKPSETDSHDFLSIPEIIEDICMSYEETVGVNLRDAFVKATRPCIVKFVSDEGECDAVAAALTYVHRRLRAEELLLECNTCFNGKGRRIPPEAILAIDWPESQQAAGLAGIKE
ncbi:MAG: hypothetical protein HYS38_03735 [Acidobacteria bacterium]|nr:hypothetical protein [Acidobacteriota bacterium]